MINDWLICACIMGMGLGYQLAIYIAFRAGRRIRGLTPENIEEKLYDFAFDTLKELICSRLEELLGLQGIELPAQLSIQDVAAHLHNDVEVIETLQNLYLSLTQLGLESPHFLEAVNYIQLFIAGGGG
jgi:hypothetical protein